MVQIHELLWINVLRKVTHRLIKTSHAYGNLLSEICACQVFQHRSTNFLHVYIGSVPSGAENCLFFFVGRNMFIDAIIFWGGFILMLMVSQGPFNLPFVCSTDMSIYSRQSVASFFIHTFIPLISHYWWTPHSITRGIVAVFKDEKKKTKKHLFVYSCVAA